MGKSQKEMILEHLKKYKSISDLEAYQEYGCRRLAARISEIRSENYNIRTVNTTKANRYGKYTTFATYVLED